ncbi:HWE histidine kinase domain-containing protein [Falsirhodobacter sp. 20TX0035]|uniref:HWE histidine kinase domain-containing protein n=1 Tax=Falsirhodobacter sp. 20TX0035 TaxID=3022019 RepID=UPI00232E9BA5|nr:HWE histidine kinase domain-containing protein [Falsirhodobacter sp. 20TX0035]MDB6453225.1 GAF domain-containing protein [Falsirhodobacter sp. 20TX0035]
MNEPVTLTNCDREPIHIPGTIQPYGALLAFDLQLQRLQQHSANSAQLIGREAVRNGEAPIQLLGPAVTARLQDALALTAEQTRPVLLFDVQLPSGRRVDMALHSNGMATMVEMEAASTNTAPLQLARLMMDRISGFEEADALFAEVTRLIRAHLGYDRVMVYEFAANGSGRVIAEEKAPHLESFLGQHFPAADIPAQARRLYLTNTIRVISDVQAERVPITPERFLGQPLDLSQAHLRSVSPIHCEYLRNMGVGASMSISIIVDGVLWGLIACHHYTPHTLPMAVRVAAEMFGEFLSLHLGALLRKRKLDRAARTRAQMQKLSRLDTSQDVQHVLANGIEDLARLLECDGVVVKMNDHSTSTGTVPDAAALDAILSHVAGQTEDGFWFTDNLADHVPQAEPFHGRTAGVLAVPISQIARDWILFFRQEQVRTVNWAGNPEKTYETGPLGDRLTPRHSFALWKEEVHRRSAPWTEDDLDTARALRTTLVEIVLLHNELLAEERDRAALRQRVLNDELNHRVKNILAVIKSVIGHPVEEGRTLESYIASLKGRIQALSFAHDQVMRGDGGGSFSALLQAELAPYRGSSVMRLEGPEALLDSRGFSVMAQILHEMATNAAKYGALSRPGGRLEVIWSRSEDGDCLVQWRESGGPAVVAPDRSGFGSLLLERSLPFDLGGRSFIDYRPTGVEAEFVLPARFVRFEETAMTSTPTALRAVPPAVPEDAHVLLLEDQLLIAMDVEAMLEEAGFKRISLARNVAQALNLVENGGIELAMLDVNLGSETSVAVAEALRTRGTPFVFATGYDETSALPETMRNVPIVRKPYDAENLIEALATAFRK